MPFAKTVRGKFSERRRARDFNNWIEGVFSECRVFDRDPLWVTDALLFDGAIAKVIDEDDEVTVDRVFPWEIAVDPQEARYGSPRTLYQRHYIDRMVLWEDFRGDRGKRDARREIEDATRATGEDMFSKDGASDMLAVTEAWHLASGQNSMYCLYVMCLDNATLTERPWEGGFPFAFLHRKMPVAGFWSPGLMKRLIPGQLEHDELSRKLQESHSIMGVPRLIIPRQANVKKAHLDDEIGSAVEFDGPQAPTEWNAMPAHPQTYQHRETVAAEMLQFSGVSAMSAQSEKPAGITAARGALQVLDDVESIRMGPFNRNRDAFYVKLAELILDTARDIATRNGGYVVTNRGKRNVTQIDLAKVEIGKDKGVVEVWPSSLLAKKPAAKIQQLEDWLKLGAIDVDRFRQLSEIPDLESEADYDAAPQDCADQAIERALEGKTVAVEPFHPHELIFARGVLAYDHELSEGADPDELGPLRSLITDCQAAIDAKAAKAAAVAPPPPVAPGAPPPPMPGAPPPNPGAPAPMTQAA